MRVSTPDKNGKRSFQVYLSAVDFNAAIVYGYKGVLPQYKQLLVKSVFVEYAGTVGTEIAVGLAQGSAGYTLLPHAVVTRAVADVTVYTGLDILVGTDILIANEIAVYFFAQGMGATDDVYLSINGECWD
jgi:hypothetical protein